MCLDPFPCIAVYVAAMHLACVHRMCAYKYLYMSCLEVHLEAIFVWQVSRTALSQGTKNGKLLRCSSISASVWGTLPIPLYAHSYIN